MTGSAITIGRRVQWIDTDAAGIWHHSVVIRWAEEAEAELHRDLGIIDQTFGVTPRVSTEFRFYEPVRFDDEVEIALSVAEVGTTSVTYDIEVSSGDRAVATGRMVAVLIDGDTGEKRPWSEELRRALEGS